MEEKQVKQALGFEAVYDIVGGDGRFQWFALAIASIQLLLMTWNHLGYIFIGAVPDHWCHIPELEYSSWSEEEIKNISILRVEVGDNWKYDQCHYYSIDYKRLLEQSHGNFETAYQMAHVENLSYDNVSHVKEYKSCEAWTYDKSTYMSTIVTEFDLVCDKRYLVATIQSSYMIGAIIGNLVLGPVSDKILGRRKTSLLSISVVIIGGFLASFSSSYIMFIAARFMIAIGTASSMSTTSIWLLEHCDTKARARMYCLENMFFGAGFAILPIYAYFIRTWSNLQLAFTLTTLSLLSFYWLLPESPRWLATQNRDDEATKALENIAHFNKMPKPDRQQLKKCVETCHENSTKENESSGCQNKACSTIKNFTVLFSTPELVKTTLTIWILFIAVGFFYYGFAFSGVNISTNSYLLIFFGGIIEVPASALPIPFLSRWGRRKSAIAVYLLTSISAFSIAMTPVNYEVLRMIEFMIGKLAVASSFTVAYFVLGEVYPTVVRSTGRSAGSLVGRFGSIVAPYVADMSSSTYRDLPSVIFGIVALVAAPFALMLPEMKGVEMKDIVHHDRENNSSKISKTFTENGEIKI